MYERPIDDIGVWMIGSDAKESAKEEAGRTDPHEDYQQADRPQAFEGLHGKSPSRSFADSVSRGASSASPSNSSDIECSPCVPRWINAIRVIETLTDAMLV
jgi:hypothetical protein